MWIAALFHKNKIYELRGFVPLDCRILDYIRHCETSGAAPKIGRMMQPDLKRKMRETSLLPER